MEIFIALALAVSIVAILLVAVIRGGVKFDAERRAKQNQDLADRLRSRDE